MYALEMSGDFSYRDFASSKRQASESIDLAISWLQKKGYKRIIRAGKRLMITSPNGGLVVIESNPTTPNGVE